ncbi:MAG: prepilin-type N-terminal cleavage/methylation domain-containing protein [Proteobacteria bacterium]|nr:prepilin-type N-terminal cleavage/methylation domain-containing protein [Pseudomonadota bacterium]MBU4298076.1 prepilin-type N-terminal cleavage/methylation domain-containing protein [Pseudomonadota bacterium]
MNSSITFFTRLLGRKSTAPLSPGAKKRRIASSGFTLIEILIVIAIMGTLSAIAMPTFRTYVERVKTKKVLIEIRMLEKEINNFYYTYNRYPQNLDEIGLDDMKDAWDNPYRYLPVEGTAPGKLRKDHFMVPVNSDFDLYSMGPDGKTASPFTAKSSRDDIVRANDGQYLGPVSEY